MLLKKNIHIVLTVWWYHATFDFFLIQGKDGVNGLPGTSEKVSTSLRDKNDKHIGSLNFTYERCNYLMGFPEASATQKTLLYVENHHFRCHPYSTVSEKQCGDNVSHSFEIVTWNLKIFCHNIYILNSSEWFILLSHDYTRTTVESQFLSDDSGWQCCVCLL